MRLLIPLLALLCLGLGLGAGYALAPRYHAAPVAGQARLRSRAEAFYRGLRRADYGAAARLMTPARQYAESKELVAKIRASDSDRRGFKPETTAALKRAAETILAGKLDVQIEGNWAVTGGQSTVYDGDTPIPMALEQQVWLWSDGEWWNYAMTKAEMAAYGNPPDFARKVLYKTGVRDLDKQQELQLGAPGTADAAGQPAAAMPPAGSTMPAPPAAAATPAPPAQEDSGAGA